MSRLAGSQSHAGVSRYRRVGWAGRLAGPRHLHLGCLQRRAPQRHRRRTRSSLLQRTAARPLSPIGSRHGWIARARASAAGESQCRGACSACWQRWSVEQCWCWWSASLRSAVGEDSAWHRLSDWSAQVRPLHLPPSFFPPCLLSKGPRSSGRPCFGAWPAPGPRELGCALRQLLISMPDGSHAIHSRTGICRTMSCREVHRQQQSQQRQQLLMDSLGERIQAMEQQRKKQQRSRQGTCDLPMSTGATVTGV